jgi:hypothetical protein
MRRRVKLGKSFDLSVSIGENSSDPVKSVPSKSKPRRVAVGSEFNTTVSLSGDWADIKDATTRSRIVWFVFGLAAIFLAGSAGLGFYRGTFEALGSVWSVIGPIYGGIAVYFFSKDQVTKERVE